MEHLPYSSDLDRCEYFLFPEVKKKMRRRTVLAPEEAVAEVVREVERRTLQTVFCKDL